MKNDNQYSSAKALTEDFKRLVDNLETYGNCSEVEHDLSLCTNKLSVFEKQFGKTSKIYKQMDRLKDQISIKIEENKTSSDFQ